MVALTLSVQLNIFFNICVHLGSHLLRSRYRTFLESHKIPLVPFPVYPSPSPEVTTPLTFLIIDFLFIYLIYLFYFWLRWVFVAARGLSLVAVSGGYSSLWCAGFSLWWLLLLRSTGSRHSGFSSCGTRALECRLSSCGARA